jgi:four helix bundle protein
MEDGRLANGDDIEERLIDFAVRIIRVSDAMPETPAGRHFKLQLLRSGTSPAPNCGEARNAESTRDFIQKHKMVSKELNETRIKLLIVIRSKLLNEERLAALLDETDQLCRIIGKSLKTARQRVANDN